MKEGFIPMGMTTEPSQPLQQEAISPPRRLSPISPDGKLPHPRQRQRGGLVWKLPVVVGVIAAVGYGGWHWYAPGSSQTTEITATVTRGDLPITVVERGELESSKTVDVRCEIEGQDNKIVTILAEG